MIEGSPSIRSRTSSTLLESSTRTRPLPVCCPFHPRPLRMHRPCPSKIRTTKTNSARNQTTIARPRGSASHRLLPRSRPRAESPLFTAHFPPRPSMSPIPLFHCICTIHVTIVHNNRATSSTMSSPPHLCITIHHTLGPYSTIVAHITHTHTHTHTQIALITHTTFR